MRTLMTMLALLGISFVYSQSLLFLDRPVSSARKTIQEPQEGAANSAQQTQGKEKPVQPSAPTLGPILNPGITPQSQEKASKIQDKNDHKLTPDWVARFTGLLVFVTFLQLIALIWQIRTSRSTAQKELRAYVLPVSAVREIENGVPKLKVILRNSGKTPALNCVSGVFRGIAPVTKPLPPLPDTSGFKSLRSESFITPGADIWMLDDDPISSEEARDIRNGVRAIYAIGTISYQDVFKARHTSRYRFMCSGNNLDSGTFVFSDEGNSIE